MSQVFLSYSREDSDFAGELVQGIEDAGLDVWLDTDDIGGGTAWRAAISGAIRTCEYFVVLLSPQSVDSRNVAKELALADQQEKPIIPVLIEPCEIAPSVEYQIAGLQRVDFTGRAFDGALADLLHALQTKPRPGRPPKRKKKSRQPPPPPPPKGLVDFLPGSWQVQITAPFGMMFGQMSVQFHPGGMFNASLMGPMGMSQVNGRWQVNGPAQLLMQGQESSGFAVIPYATAVQFARVTQDQLSGTTAAGENVECHRTG